MFITARIAFTYKKETFCGKTDLPRYLRDASEIGVLAKFRYSKAVQPMATFLTVSSYNHETQLALYSPNCRNTYHVIFITTNQNKGKGHREPIRAQSISV